MATEFVTHGASAALAAAILAVVDPGDKVVIPEPGYSLYGDLVQLAGGTPVFVPATADLHLGPRRPSEPPSSEPS